MENEQPKTESSRSNIDKLIEELNASGSLAEETLAMPVKTELHENVQRALENLIAADWGAPHTHDTPPNQNSMYEHEEYEGDGENGDSLRG